MNILTYTNLYPNRVNPSHGIFVERRLQLLSRGTDIRPAVVAPVPWFPSTARIFGRHAVMAQIERQAVRSGIPVYYPRYPVIPKLGMNMAAHLMAAGTKRPVQAAISAHGGAQLIDAHYFYPDGVAAGMIARSLGIPYVITARGSDINLIANFRWPRRLMLRAAAGAAAIIAVSRALAEAMACIGIPPDRIHVLRNGVDLDFFRPATDATVPARKSEPQFLSVGALKASKGHDIAIRFIAGIDGAQLTIAGAGPDEQTLKRLAADLGVAGRIRFTGILDAESLRDCYQSADALILMSAREGMPNVILESLACGTPVLATGVGGIPEILNVPSAGVVVDDRSAAALASAWRELCDRGVMREDVRCHAEGYSWHDTVAGLARLMLDCAADPFPEDGNLSHKSH